MLFSLITHPEYDLHFVEWLKWRLAYIGGKRFINTYLKRLSRRETQPEFDERMDMTYCPAFAKTGLNEIRDSIYNRMVDISRDGGTKSYQDACKGEGGGVDLFGSSMNFFMGCKILPELLTMQRVGIYVDMPPLQGESVADNAAIRPYVYLFAVEDIRCWVMDESNNRNDFASILLQERVEKHDEETGFPISQELRYRRLWKDESGEVLATFQNEKGDTIDQFGERIYDPIPLGISKIPFIILDIGESLMTDVADYQIALMNLASTDMSYIIRSNFPFYTEQVDPRMDNQHTKPAGDDSKDITAKPKEIAVGAGKGRMYQKGMERPGFIHPSSEPLKASMEKQEQLKSEIRMLLKLAVTNLSKPHGASAESKKLDTRSLESGLGYIGMLLEHAERKIADYWSIYEGKKDVATVNYPIDYTLNDEEERRKEAAYLTEVSPNVVSETFQRVVQKRLAKISVGTKVSTETLKKIDTEIDNSESLINNPETLFTAIEAGVLDLELASKLMGFPKDTVEKAAKQHTDRLARIAIAQSEGAAAGATVGNSDARGVKDAGGKTSKEEKKASLDTTKDPIVKTKVRGEGK